MMARPRRRHTDQVEPRAVRLGLLTAVCVAVIAAALFIAGYSLATRSVDNSDTATRLCANQHSIIEMQRLFLAEHAAIRTQLLDAGIPADHADPHLLERLEELIEAADCDPAAIP